jgi:hypothetical protein
MNVQGAAEEPAIIKQHKLIQTLYLGVIIFTAINLNQQ